MTPAARVQAAIDILDEVIAAAQGGGAAADTIIANWFRSRRFAGSKDRRAVRDLVYDVIRAFATPPSDGRAGLMGMLGPRPDLFDGSRYGPAAPAQGEGGELPGLLPGWMQAILPPHWAETAGERATLDLRVNRRRATREDILTLYPDAQAITGLDHALRLRTPRAVEGDTAWAAGLVDVQDAGSQWVVEACAAQPGETAIDLCAGAGGKALALAEAMVGEGRLIACDVNRERLARLGPRAARLGANMIETRLLDGGREADNLLDLAGAADLVLVDAPCSGSGTWRRNPEGRWRLTPDRLERLIALQSQILDLAARLVRPGGRLVYAVCSVIDGEGATQIARFLERQAGWRAVPPAIAAGEGRGDGRRLTPMRDETDGFFVASLARN